MLILDIFVGPHFDTTYPQQKFRRGSKKEPQKVITFGFFFGSLPREILLQIAPPDTANAEPGVWSFKSSQFGCLRDLKRCQIRSKKCIKIMTLLCFLAYFSWRSKPMPDPKKGHKNNQGL